MRSAAFVRQNCAPRSTSKREAAALLTARGAGPVCPASNAGRQRGTLRVCLTLCRRDRHCRRSKDCLRIHQPNQKVQSQLAVRKPSVNQRAGRWHYSCALPHPRQALPSLLAESPAAYNQALFERPACFFLLEPVALMALATSELRPSHRSDPSLQPFVQPTFDAAAYLNATLPPLHLSSTPVSQRSSGSVTLGDLSTQTNQLLSQLNAQASRLTNSLTQLTDDILRSGPKLAYEVEVLRGETTGLSEALNETLRSDVELFVPSGLITEESPSEKNHEQSESTGVEDATHPRETAKTEAEKEPDYIASLRTLNLVRRRLESVIHLFGEAMRWTLPSNETGSLTTSFISVSAPTDPSPTTATHATAARDEKARDFAATLRQEIGDLIISNPDGLAKGHAAALERVQALRDLARVWSGTAEERPRARFVDGLARLADERLREAEKEADSAKFDAVPPQSRTPGRTRKSTQTSRVVQAEKGVGFLDNLYKLRGSSAGER